MDTLSSGSMAAVGVVASAAGGDVGGVVISNSSSSNPGGLSVSIPPAPPEEEVVEVVVVSDEEGHHGPPPELLEELQGNKSTLVHTQRTFTHSHKHSLYWMCIHLLFPLAIPLHYTYKREMGSFAVFFSPRSFLDIVGDCLFFLSFFLSFFHSFFLVLVSCLS